MIKLKHTSSSHLTGAMRSVIAKHGSEGYGVYWILSEMIAASKYKYINIGDADIEAKIEKSSKVEISTVMTIIQTCVHKGLLCLNGTKLAAVKIYLSEFNAQRSHISSNAAKARWGDKGKAEEKVPVKPKKKAPVKIVFDDEKPVVRKPKKPALQFEDEVPVKKQRHHFFENAEYALTFDKFIEMRKLIKKPMTEHAKELIVKKTERFGGGNVNKAIIVLNRSIESSWQGVFELPPDYAKKESTTTEKKPALRNDT